MLAAEWWVNWGRGLVAAAFDTAAAFQEQMAFGVFRHWSKRRASSPAVVVAAAGIAGEL